MVVGLATTVKAWLNFPALLNFFVPFRSSVLAYLSKLVDTELKTTSARNMNGEEEGNVSSFIIMFNSFFLIHGCTVYMCPYACRIYLDCCERSD